MSRARPVAKANFIYACVSLHSGCLLTSAGRASRRILLERQGRASPAGLDWSQLGASFILELAWAIGEARRPSSVERKRTRVSNAWSWQNHQVNMASRLRSRPSWRCWPRCAPAAAQRAVPESAAAIKQSFAPVVKQAAPAVVNVYVRHRVEQMVSPFFDDPFFGRLFGERFGIPRERIQNSLGSGVLVGTDGRGRHQQPCHSRQRRGRDHRGADRRAGIPGQGHPQGRADRSRGAPARCRGRAVLRRSSSAIPTVSRSAIWCWPSAIRSASARR